MMSIERKRGDCFGQSRKEENDERWHLSFSLALLFTAEKVNKKWRFLLLLHMNKTSEKKKREELIQLCHALEI